MAFGYLDGNQKQFKNDKISSVYVDGKCFFSIKAFPGQAYNNRIYMFYHGSHADPNGWGFGIGCYAGATQEDINNIIGAEYVGGKWKEIDSGEPFKPRHHFKVISFAGKNWHAVAVAFDQLYYAEAERRSRFFNFCLFENDGPQILCGQTQVRGVTQPESASKQPEIISVLKTIEFVDPPVSEVDQVP